MTNTLASVILKESAIVGVKCTIKQKKSWSQTIVVTLPYWQQSIEYLMKFEILILALGFLSLNFFWQIMVITDNQLALLLRPCSVSRLS